MAAATPFAFLLGALATDKGLSVGEAGLMSALVFAGSAQFIALDSWTMPPAWLALLAPGGRLVAPVGGDGLQALEVVDVQAGPQGPIFNRQRLEGVAFVPLRSGIA